MPYCHESTAWHCTARDWVHMYTQPHSYYSSIPCCLVHVTLELSHWHLRKKIGHYIMADFGLRNGLLWFVFKHTYLCYCSLVSVTLPFLLPLIGVDTAVRRHHPPPARRLDQSDTRNTLIYPSTHPWHNTNQMEYTSTHVTDSELSKVAINTSRGHAMPRYPL